MGVMPPSRWCSRQCERAATFVGSKSIARAATVVERAGFGAQFIHRTGHSLGEEVHGNGVHMDDYETHDDRRLLPGTGFTIEPGVYTDRYGVRTEINMFVGEREARVTGPLQQEVVILIDIRVSCMCLRVRLRQGSGGDGR